MMQDALLKRPNVWLVGDADHADFAEAVTLLRATASVGPGLPELIVVAQSRPGTMRLREFERLRRSVPLAGVVSLCGSWCEGETRTGRPAAGVRRLYWYEFPSWWRRQIALRAAGQCPDWARVEGDFRLQIAECGLMNKRIAVETSCWDTAAAIRDVLHSAGAETVWSWPERGTVNVEGVAAGIWEGGQLSDSEAKRLAAFCGRMAGVDAPVLALLDFPRRERCDVARAAGAVGVLGKPWGSGDLLGALGNAVAARRGLASAA
jgi:hypothetical protein